jgi:ADP-heptose:LPS heptosyltransferase
VSGALVVRLDSMGDVLISGPAVRAVAASTRVSMLVGPLGVAAAKLLPAVEEVLIWDCPWISGHPEGVDPEAMEAVRAGVAARRFDQAVILTSFHQSALPTALMLRLAGVARITAISEDYPGGLLDVRVAPPPDGPEPERMLAVARAAGFDLAAGDDGRLRLRAPLPSVKLGVELGVERPIVVHPGVSASARAYAPAKWREVVAELAASGATVLVTGSKSEAELTAEVAGGAGMDCGGRFTLPELAAVAAQASVMLVGNTGPAHLAAAVRTPVVSLFAPVVPATRWAPYGVATKVLGDQDAACRASRATRCPVPGHPCLANVDPSQVVRAARELIGAPRPAMVGGVAR